MPSRSTSSSSRSWSWTCAAEIYDKLQRLSFRFFDANTTGSIITRVTGDVQSVRMFVDQVLIQSVIMVISLTVYAIYMASLSPGLTVACLATTPLLWILAALFSRKIQPEYAENRNLVERMVQYLAESIQGIAVVKGFGREDENREKFDAGNSAVLTPAVQHLLAGEPLLPDGGLPDPDQHDGAPRLRRLAGRRRVGCRSGAGLVVFAGLLDQFAGQVNNVADDRQLGPAVADRRPAGLRDPGRPDRGAHRRPTPCGGPASRARSGSRMSRSSTAGLRPGSAGHRTWR